MQYHTQAFQYASDLDQSSLLHYHLLITLRWVSDLYHPSITGQNTAQQLFKMLKATIVQIWLCFNIALQQHYIFLLWKKFFGKKIVLKNGLLSEQFQNAAAALRAEIPVSFC